jgi:hypothetical protein
MSTKATIYLDNDFHLYKEGWDDDNVYLELESSSQFVEKLAVKIPVAVWNEMRKRSVPPTGHLPGNGSES